MKISGFALAACAAITIASAPQAVSQQATADKPAMCWDYNTLADNVGSRFGLNGAVDDTILSRSAYYTLTKLPVKASSPLAAGTSTWFKIEFRAEAEGADAPVSMTGLLVDLDNPIMSASMPGRQFERHFDANKKFYSLELYPLEARFKAGDAVVTAPFRAQGPDHRRQEITLRLGAYAPPTWQAGKEGEYDPKATLPLVEQIDAAWKKAGAMTIEIAIPETGAVVATSEPLAYVGDKAAAEFARMNSRAPEMIKGGKCQFLGD